MNMNWINKLLMVSLLGLGVTACGDDDDSTPTPDAGPDTTEDTGDTTPEPDSEDDTEEDTTPTPDSEDDTETTPDIEEDTDVAPDTDVEEPDPVVDACLNDDDLAYLQPDNGAAATSEATSCGLDSLSAPDPRQTSLECIVAETGLSEECAGCYADTVACTINNCLAQCAANPSAPACTACQETNCLPDFFACRGDITPDEEECDPETEECEEECDPETEECEEECDPETEECEEECDPETEECEEECDPETEECEEECDPETEECDSEEEPV